MSSIRIGGIRPRRWRLISVTEEGFIKVDITPEMKKIAQEKATEMGLLRNSIRKGAGNLAGFLGEEVVIAAWPGAVSDNTYEHDVVFEGTTFEVKTKDRTVRPHLDYDASVANFNPRQKADYYVFVSLERKKDSLDYHTGYILGIMTKKEYMERSRHYQKGDIDHSNGWIVSADCYNLQYRWLYRFC